MVKHLPTMWETWVRSLSWKVPLEKEIATHSSILAWKIPWTEEPGALQSMGSQRVGHDWATSHTWHTLCFLPGGSDSKESAFSAEDPILIPRLGRSPGEVVFFWRTLRYSCLENPIGRGAWCATVHGVSKSQTPLSYWRYHDCTIFNMSRISF